MSNRCLLYYITDRSQFRNGKDQRHRALLDKVAEAARAGVDYIQLRERDLRTRELETLAREVIAVVRDNSDSTRLLINCRTDVALAAGADGVHLRADDIAPDDVRRVLVTIAPSTHRTLTTDHFLIFASCHTAADVLRANSNAADFAVFAPVFGKSNAPATQPAGLDALREACQAKIPVLALGGVTLANAASCLNAGGAGIAGIRLFQENKVDEVVQAVRALRP
jgi:thiamine-phosphate pyrophosphorylase